MEPALTGLQPVWVHDSARAERQRLVRVRSLQHGRIAPALHYSGARQAELWLKVHQIHAPLFQEPGFREIFSRLAALAAVQMAGRKVHVIGLGAGGGSKETQVLRALRESGCALDYTPVDASLDLALTSADAARPHVNGVIRPVTADLQHLDGSAFEQWLGTHSPQARRVFTAFGLSPNFLPSTFCELLAGLLRPDDLLLLSANLAPEPPADTEHALDRILPQYDNAETHAWLRQILVNWSLDAQLSPTRFEIGSIEDVPSVSAYCNWLADAKLVFEGEPVTAKAGQRLDLFFSLRYTPRRLRTKLTAHGLELGEGFLTPCGQEGAWTASTTRSPH